MPYGSIFYDKLKSTIYGSVYDENNVRTPFVEKWVPDYFLETRTDGEYVSEDGVPLKRREFRTWSQHRKSKSEDKEMGLRVYGSDLSPENKFILERWPEDILVRPKINAMIVDIETECEKGFPEPEKADERISLITCHSNIDNRFTTFGFKDWDRSKSELPKDVLDRVDFVLCDDEEEMLVAFIEYLERTKHDIWSGWNCLEENQTVWLDNKIRKIKNISKNNENIPLLETDNHINKHVYTGEKDMFIINNSLGKKIKCSKKHVFFVKSKLKDEYKKFSTLNKSQEEELSVEELIEKQKTHDVFTKWELHENVNEDLSWRSLFELDEFWERLLKNPYIDFPIKNKKIVELVKNDRSILNDYCYGKDFWKRTFEWNFKNNTHLYNSEVLRAELLDNSIVDYTYLNKRFSVNLDDVITENDLKVLGFIFTDGCWDTSRRKGSNISFTQKYKNTLENYRNIILDSREIKSINIKECVRDREISPEKYYSMRVTASNFALLLNLIYDFDGESKYKNPEITSLSMCSNKQFLSFFTGCFDGDGCSSSGSISICNYDCKKFDFLQSLQELLLWNNIISTVNKQNNNISVAPDMINKDLFRYVKDNSLNDNRSKNITEVLKQNKQTSRKKIKYMYNENIVYSKIASIEETKEKVPMYDIETKTHSFLTGGCKTHNCSGFDIPYIFNRIMRVLDGIDLAEYNRLLDIIKVVPSNERAQYYAEIKILESKMDYTKRLSLYGQVSKVQKMVKDSFTKEMKKEMAYTIQGVTDNDYMKLDKKFRMGKRDSYKLDDVAFDELNARKMEYEGTIKEFQQNEWNRFTDYNILDVDLVVRLEDKLGYISQSISLSYMCHCQFRDNFGTVIKAETAIYNFLMKEGIVANDGSEEGEDDEDHDKIPGAYVTKKHELRRGKHRWIIDLDVASLYPSLMRGINISYDTKVGKILTQKNIFEMDEDEEVTVLNGETKTIQVGKLRKYIIAQGYQVSTNNIIFKNIEKDKGVLVKMLDKWYAQRKIDQKLSSKYRTEAFAIFVNSEGSGTHEVEDDGVTKMLTDKEFKEYTELSRLEGIHYNLQWSCKILLNSIYGCLACSFFRGFDRDVASAVTLSGQTIIKTNGNLLNNYFNIEVFDHPMIKKNFKVDESIEKVDVLLYQDTDSCYLTFDRLMDKLGVPNVDKDRLKVTKFLAKIAERKLAEFAEDFFPKRFNAKNSIFWDQELIARTGIWCAPKKYVCHILEEKGKAPKHDMLKKGLDIVRSSIPRKFKTHLTTCVDNMLKDHSQAELHQYIKDLYKEFRGWTIKEISIPSSCNNLAKWGKINNIGFLPSTPQHMKAGISYNYYRNLLGLTQYEPIKEKDRFYMVFVKRNPEYPVDTFGYVDILPREMELERLIDWDAHFERGFVKPLKQIFDAMKWTFPETSVEFQDSDDLFE